MNSGTQSFSSVMITRTCEKQVKRKTGGTKIERWELLTEQLGRS